MMTYQLKTTVFGGTIILRQNDDGSTTSFGINPDNTDYQAYLRWLEAGNTPEPAEENH